MIHKIKIFLFPVLFAVIPSAGQGIYLGFDAAYNMPVAGSVLGLNRSSDWTANTYSNENIYGSFGRGIGTGIHGGYMFTSNFGLELRANYLFGQTYKFTTESVSSPGLSDQVRDEVSFRSLRLCPQVRMEFGENKIHPYLGAGMSFAIMNRLKDFSTEKVVNSSLNTDVIKRTMELTGGVGIGFSGTIGINYQLSDHIAISAELNNYYLSWGPSKGEMTQNDLNDVSQLSSMDTRDKKFEFVDKVDQTMNTDPASPSKERKVLFPLSSYGLGLGMQFKF